jgi:hypothetical protein
MATYLTSNIFSDVNIAGNCIVQGSLTTGNPVVFRNRVINGDFKIDQRNNGASFTPTVVGKTYALDRWWGWIATASKFSVQRSTEVPVGQGFTNSVLVTSLSAYSTPVGGYYGFGQHIEGYNIADMGFGTASATTATLSFWARSSIAGTFSVALENGSFNRSYIFNYTISSVNTWQYFTLPFRADITGTWDNTTGQGVRLWWDLGSNDTTYAGAAGSWLAADKLRTTGSVSLIGTNAATLYIAGVQLEKGSVATPFEVRPYATELALCQRYYVRFTGDGAFKPLGLATALSTTAATGIIVAPTSMRSQPTIIDISSSSNTCAYTSSMIQGTTTHTTNDVYLYSAGTNFGFTTIGGTGNGVASLSWNLIGMTVSGGSGITAGWSGMLYMPSGKYIGFSAEL